MPDTSRMPSTIQDSKSIDFEHEMPVKSLILNTTNPSMALTPNWGPMEHQVSIGKIVDKSEEYEIASPSIDLE